MSVRCTMHLDHALPHQKSSPAACSTGRQEFLAGFAADETGRGDRPWITSACHCSSNCFQQVGSYFPHASLEGADLQRLIASGGEALQLPEDVPTASFRIGNQPGHDLLPLSFKGVFLGTSPAQDAFSPLLLSVQGMESCCRIGDAPLGMERFPLYNILRKRRGRVQKVG